MYRVVYVGVRGAQFTKECEYLDEACMIALNNRYGFLSINDKNGNAVFDIIKEDPENEGVYIFCRAFKM